MQELPVNVLLWLWGREGASAKFTLELLQELRKVSGLNVTLSCADNSELNMSAKQHFADLTIDTISTFSGSKGSLFGKLSAVGGLARLPFTALRFRQIVRSRKIDVAICTFSSIWDAASLPILWRGRLRYIQILHEITQPVGDSYPVRDWVTRQQIAVADAVIVLSEYVKQQVGKGFGYPADRLWKMPHGAFAFGSKTVRTAVHPRGARPVRLLFLGRITQYKGIDRLLSATDLVLQRGLPVQLVIAGSGSLKLDARLSAAHVEVHNRWLDEDEMGDFLATSDVVVLPYSASSQSGVAASAYAAGRPVVATPIGGLAEQVRDGSTGLLARDMSAEAFADALAAFVDDPSLLDACGVGALQHAQGELGWCDCTRVVADAINAVRARPRRRLRHQPVTPSTRVIMDAEAYIKRVIPRGILKHAGDLRRRLRCVASAFNAGERYQMAIGDFGGFQVAYRTATADEDVLDDSFENDIFLTELPEYESQLGDTILDVGAHIGTFSLLAATKVPHGRVLAIEASMETYNFLRVNIALNNLQNVTPVHLALADGPGFTVLHHDQGNWGHSIMKQFSSHGEQVPKNSLSGFCAEHNITKIGLIKFNCEGAEFPILLNTPVEFLRNVRAMLVLYHCDLVSGYSREDLLEHLRSAGFTTAIRNENGERGWIVASRRITC
jgi:FkbM family methyltransferase